MSTSLIVGLALVNLVELALIARIFVRLKGTARVNERLSHFAEALALLTDTTEAGLAGVASAIEHARPARTGAGRAATSRRIASAARKGRTVAQIAADEALSEGEIRLHLGMTAGAAKEERDGAVRV